MCQGDSRFGGLPDLFLVRGTTTMGPGRIGRNMVVIRHEGELSPIGAVRMPAESETGLESLGRVANIIRLCDGHGLDDAYTAQRFGAKFWCATDADFSYAEPRPDVVFEEGDSLPISPASLVRFGGILGSEIAVVWHRNGGVVVTGDALQHYDDWHGFDIRGWLFIRLSGFIPDTVVGPMWRRLQSYDDAALRASFDKLLDHDFRHAIALHGTFVKDHACDRIRRAVDREFTKPLLRDWAYRLMMKQIGPLLEERKAQLRARGKLPG